MIKKLRFLSLILITFCLASCKTSAQQKASISLENQSWTLTEMNGEKPEVSDDSKAHFLFSVEDKKVSGYSGCNRFSAPYELADNKLHINNILSTRRACMGNNIEGQLFEILKTTDKFSIENKTLILFDKSGKSIAKFAASETKENEKR